jgi:diacylglycerol kinase family enzyme
MRATLHAARAAGFTTKMLEGIKTASIIFNPVSGRGKSSRPKQLEEARKILAASGIDAELRPTSGPGHAGEIASRAIVEGSQLIIACGGDGTLNEIVNGMPGSKVPIALLPAGTANILAKELGIPWNIPRAAALIPRGTPTRIALGAITRDAAPSQLNSPAESRRYFIVVAGAGADGALVHALNPSVKLAAGVLAYWMEGFKQLVRYKFPQFRVITSEKEVVASLVIVGRTKNYGGPFRITTGADLFADEFELALFRSQSALRYLLYLPACWMGRLRHLKDVHFVKTNSLRCEPMGADSIYAQVDGEGSESLPVTFSIVPDALTLIVPENFRASQNSMR